MSESVAKDTYIYVGEWCKVNDLKRYAINLFVLVERGVAQQNYVVVVGVDLKIWLAYCLCTRKKYLGRLWLHYNIISVWWYY